MPSVFNASGLLSVFNNDHMTGKRMLVPGSNIARKELSIGLRKLRFNLDAAILFSDILVVPEALSQKLEFRENHGPVLSHQVLEEKTVSELDVTRLEHNLNYVTSEQTRILPFSRVFRDVVLASEN